MKTKQKILKVPKAYVKQRRDIDGLTNTSGLFTLEGIKELEINTDKLRRARKRLNANEIVADYYKEYYDERCLPNDRAETVRNCFTFALVDYYRLLAVKDIKSVNLCHDKFCINCQNQISLRRFAKYKPFLDSLQSDYDIYHIVFVVLSPARFLDPGD